MKRYGILMMCISMLSLFLTAGCSNVTETASVEHSLKIGLMPAVDAAPILLAQQRNYFYDLGLNVEIEIYNNALNRQSALQAQTIDGAITDLIAVAVNVSGGFDIKATMTTDGVFPVLYKEGSENKQAIKVGMMEVSVTNYLMDEWLGVEYEIEKVFINEIPTRLAAIVSGELDMGLFPEPVASMGMLQGLEKKVYAYKSGYCPDVMVFTGKALREKEEAIRLFHQAYNRAVEDIRKDEQVARDILMDKIPNLKPEIKDLIILPEYTLASLPDNEYIENIIRWTAETLGKDLKVDAEDLIERKFILE